MRAFRLARTISHLLIGVTLAAIVLPFCTQNGKKNLVKWWSKQLLNCFNIQLVAHHSPHVDTRQIMFVSNHISWVDIFAINSVFPLRFIAKSEVSQWPVLGYLVRKSGTLFINRSTKKDALRVVHQAASALKVGENFCFFPEGTTTDGTQLVTFKSSVLQAAIDAAAVIQPIAIRYPNEKNQPNLQMAYAGETSLWQSVSAILQIKAPIVEVNFLPKIELGMLPEANRHAASRAAFDAISNKLKL